MFSACSLIFDFVDDFRKSFDICSLWAESHTELVLGGISVISSYCLLKSLKKCLTKDMFVLVSLAWICISVSLLAPGIQGWTGMFRAIFSAASTIVWQCWSFKQICQSLISLGVK